MLKSEGLVHWHDLVSVGFLNFLAGVVLDCFSGGSSSKNHLYRRAISTAGKRYKAYEKRVTGKAETKKPQALYT